MDVIYHRLIQKDLKSAIIHYPQEGGVKLGNRFFDEVEVALDRIEKNPTGHHFSDGGLRRVGLK